MKSSIALLLFALMVFVATTSARPNHSESDLSTFDDERNSEHSIAQNRQYNRRQRRRHSRQISDGYDYLPPWYYHDKNMKEIRLIHQQISEIKDAIKNIQSSQSTPVYILQPIYVPYNTFPFENSSKPPAEKPCSCKTCNNKTQINSRLPPIWGGSDNNVDNDDEDAEDEGRPISFNPVNSNNPQGRPPPPVEHGSVQEGFPSTTTTTPKPKKTPGPCEAAILLCCRFPKTEQDTQKNCFMQYKCQKTYETGRACSRQAIAMVIQRFKDAYAPT